MKGYLPKSGKKVWWVCTGNRLHAWCTSICERTGHDKTNCPRCNNSKLEMETEKALVNLELKFDQQVKKDFAKNITHLPYDFEILFSNKKILLELQGEHHFYYSSYHNRKPGAYRARINTDIKKSVTAHKNTNFFLSISYLCMDNIQKIISEYLKETENHTFFSRYYITPDLFLEYSDTNLILEMPLTNNDEILTIFQTYALHILAIKNKTGTNYKFEFCSLCEEMYCPELIHHHYQTETHRNAYGQRLYELSEHFPCCISLTQDGENVLTFEEEGEEGYETP